MCEDTYVYICVEMHDSSIPHICMCRYTQALALTYKDLVSKWNVGSMAGRGVTGSMSKHLPNTFLDLSLPMKMIYIYDTSTIYIIYTYTSIICIYIYTYFI